MTDSRRRAGAVAAASIVVLALGDVTKVNAAQFGGIVKGAACLGAGYAGFKLGEKMADFEARKLNLSPEQARKHRLAFTIGMALALCGGGAAIAGTTHSRLSKRGKQAREREVMAALDDAKPHTYVDPDNPGLSGTTVAQPALVEGESECRIVEDQLGDDQALVKYCRKLPDGRWSVKTV